MNKLRERFTKWYYRKGYRMEYRDCSIGKSELELIFHCPWWVRPLVYLFWSPCVYYHEQGYDFAKGFMAGFSREI